MNSLAMNILYMYIPEKIFQTGINREALWTSVLSNYYPKSLSPSTARISSHHVPCDPKQQRFKHAW